MIYSKKDPYISVCYVSSVSVCVCVCGFFLLFSSRPRHVTNSMKEVIIGRSSALPGGTTCIWMQAFALSQDLSCILYLYHSFTHFILRVPLLHSPPLSHMHSLIMCIAPSLLSTWRNWVFISRRFRTALLFTVCLFFPGSHPLSVYYNTAPDPHCHPPTRF